MSVTLTRRCWRIADDLECSTEDEFRAFIRDFFYPNAPEKMIAPVFDLYPNDPSEGSPFGTGDANQLSPEYKRMSAFQGDYTFQAGRRLLLDQRSHKQPTWSFSERPCTFLLWYL